MNCLNQAISEERIHQILIRFGVSVNAVDDEKRTALHYACADGKCRVIELLLKEHSIKLNEQDNSGQTPLMLAATNGQLRAARIIASRLIKFDLDIDIRDDKGYTALLHAIKNQNYGIAYDLIKYANASSTIRDDENFKNATEWLKKTVDDKQKQENINRSRRASVKPVTVSDKSDHSEEEEVENVKDKSSRVPSAIPLLTISSLPGASEQEGHMSMGEYSLARMVAETSKSKPISDRDIFQRSSRPTSSARSKASLSSAKNLPKMPIVVEQEPGISEIKTRPSTAADDGSVYSCNISQGSRLGDDLVSTPGRSLFSNTVTDNKPKKLGNIAKTPKEKLSSARKSARSQFEVDLGQINVPPSEYSYAPTHSENVFFSGDIRDLPEKDLSGDNMAAVEVLKRALKNQKKNKVSRTSTSMSLSHQQQANKNNITTPLVSPSIQARTTGRRSSIATAEDTTLFSSRNPTKMVKMTMRRFLSQSTLSDDFQHYDHLDPEAIEQAKKNMQAIFSLYTESLLWTPLPKKPESLQVTGNESDKMTLASDFTTSVSDLASIIEHASVAPSEDGNTRTSESKPASSKSRLVSATSRGSRKSARVSSSRVASGLR